MEASLQKSCAHHDQMIQAIAEKDEATLVRLVFEHWELSPWNMEMFIAPRALTSEAMRRLESEGAGRKPKAARKSKA